MVNMTVNFLLQATRVLNGNKYDEEELEMIFNYLTKIDNEILIDYNSTCTIISYNNDLELYVEILDTLIPVFEEREEYEKCDLLLKKKQESLKIMNSKTI